MKKFSNTFNPIIEDQNFHIYQKLVESCSGYIEEIEKDIKYPEQIRSIIAYMAKTIYDLGFSDGLTIDNVCEEPEKETIFN